MDQTLSAIEILSRGSAMAEPIYLLIYLLIKAAREGVERLSHRLGMRELEIRELREQAARVTAWAQTLPPELLPGYLAAVKGP